MKGGLTLLHTLDLRTEIWDAHTPAACCKEPGIDSSERTHICSKPLNARLDLLFPLPLLLEHLLCAHQHGQRIIYVMAV